MKVIVHNVRDSPRVGHREKRGCAAMHQVLAEAQVVAPRVDNDYTL
jgi:hypothetical protein